MSTRQLSPRQREMRKMMIRERPSIRRLCEHFGIDRVTCWRDRCAIADRAPLPADPFDESSEIPKALAKFDEHHELVSDELRRVDDAAEVHAGSPGQAMFLNLRANLLGQLRDIEKQRQAFCVSIGLFTSPESRHHHTHDYAGMTQAQAEAEAAAIEDVVDHATADD
jgi:hypothetical protein